MQSRCHGVQVSAGQFLKVYLEVEDASVLSISEALTLRDHSSQDLFIQGQRGNGGEQPAVTWTTTDRGGGLKSNKQNAHTEYEVGEGKLLMDIKAKSDWSFNLPMGL